MTKNYRVGNCFDFLQLITSEFLLLDFDKPRWGELPARKLYQLSRRAEILQDFCLMFIDPETARRLRNKTVLSRIQDHEQSIIRTQHLAASKD